MNTSVGLLKGVEVGTNYKIGVGGSMTTNVTTLKTITVGQKLTLNCGGSTVILDSGGDVVVNAAATVKVVAGTIDLN